jgi:regulator of sirC expression with transglutaminase-like and TPR domain
MADDRACARAGSQRTPVTENLPSERAQAPQPMTASSPDSIASTPEQLAAPKLRKRSPPARISTLIGLLGDGSPTVLIEVRRELARHGRQANSALRRATRGADPQARAHARLLLLAMDRESVVRRMVCFASREKLELERGLWLLSRLDRPELDVRPYLLALDAMAAEVAKRIESKPPGLERALLLPKYLGGELGFCGDQEDYHHPDNVFVHRAIERRRGLPLTLVAIYLFVARRAGLSASAVPLPGHVMLRLRDGGKSAVIDVFAGGEVLSERQILKYLADHKLPFHPRWFGDAGDDALFQRQINNLRASWQRRGLAREVRGLELVLGALSSR